MHELDKKRVIIIGAGPAGLTAGYLLCKEGVPVTILELDPKHVGGISRTAQYKDFLFDIGGHRFFSKSEEVEALWTELLPDDMIDRPRSSKIYYRNRFFSYPLKAFEALFKLGIMESVLCVLSYGWARLFPVKKPRNFQEWVSNQFGTRLFNIFFKTYTEKVWGMPCTEISADWAAQRIKGLSLASAIKSALLPQRKPKNRGEVIKTLIDTFRYPRKGPGMMWEACAERIREMGGEIHMGCRASDIRRFDDESLIDTPWEWAVTYRDAEGHQQTVGGNHVISSAPMRELIQCLEPAVSPATLAAAESLRYRDFITVVLILEDKDQFSDNWIYIHDPDVQVGRVQNFKSWSPEMVPQEDLTCYGLEYFCFEDDALWNGDDSDLVEMATCEIIKLGLAQPGDVRDGCVVRQKKAYPIYDEDYAKHVSVIRDELAKNYPNLHLVGRNGMHKYNNQDHAMMTAMLTARNIADEKNSYDVWEVNEDAEYHEAGESGTDNLYSSD